MSEVAVQRTNRDSEERLTRRLHDAVERKNTIPPELAEQRKRIAAFRDAWANNALPDIPKIPGYHTCWGTTESKVDTIPGRIALGYSLVKLEDFSKEEQDIGRFKVSSGEFPGAVSCNEMIALKIPQDLYQEAMLIMHHEDPLQFQQNITEQLRGAAEKQRGSHTILEGGFLEMEKAQNSARSRPKFTD